MCISSHSTDELKMRQKIDTLLTLSFFFKNGQSLGGNFQSIYGLQYQILALWDTVKLKFECTSRVAYKCVCL